MEAPIREPPLLILVMEVREVGVLVQLEVM